MKVLVIDDEPDICRVVKKLVEKRGHECTAASDGIQGIDLLKSEHYDLVLLDLKMPEMNGFDVLRMLAYGGQLYEKRVVILSALNLTNKEKEQMKSAGVSEILSKPFAPESIERLLGLIARPTVVDKQ